MPKRGVAGYSGISTIPIETTGVAPGVWDISDYTYFKRQGKIPSLNNSLPVGSLILYAGSTNPDSNRFIVADGSTLSGVGTYAALYGVIGTSFGGSGGNFNIPNLTGHVISHEPTNIGITTAATTGVTHNHGTITPIGGSVSFAPYKSGYSAAGGFNSNNGAITTNSGSETAKFREHTLLPLISIRDTYIPAGCVIYSFRDPTKARATGRTVLCDGSTISPSTNSQLYSLTGVAYGGSAIAFAVPNLRGCFPKCSKTFNMTNQYSLDTHPIHHHGTFNGYNPINSGAFNFGFGGGGSYRANEYASTSAGSSGNGTEYRADNFSAHPMIVTSTTELSPGDLVFYLGSTSRDKMVSLNGGTLSASSYTALADGIETDFINGGNIEVLDCRNKYVRATDRGSGRDPDASVRTHGGTSNTTSANIAGTFQDQAYPSHTHTYLAATAAIYSIGGNNHFNSGQLVGTTQDTANMAITWNSTAQSVSSAAKINIPRIRTNICMYTG